MGTLNRAAWRGSVYRTGTNTVLDGMNAPSGAGAWLSKTSRVLPRPWTAEGIVSGETGFGGWVSVAAMVVAR